MAGEVDELYVVNADWSGQRKRTERGHDARWSPGRPEDLLRD